MKGGGKRGHRHWPFHSQRTRLLCSTGLSYSLLTHIMLHQFIHINQTEARSSGKKRIRKRRWQRLRMKKNASSSQKRRKQRALGNEDTEKHWQRLRMKKKEFACTSKSVRPQACVNNSLGPPTEVHSVKGRGRHVYKLSLGCPTTFWGFDQPDVSILNQNITNSENPKCCVCISSSSGIWWLPNDQRSKKVPPNLLLTCPLE